MFLPLDGPALQGTISVNNTTPQEVKIGASALEERKVVTLQPLDGDIYVYFAQENVVPNAATIIGNGFEHYKRARDSYEAGNNQKIYILSKTGTVSVKVAERG